MPTTYSSFLLLHPLPLPHVMCGASGWLVVEGERGEEGERVDPTSAPRIPSCLPVLSASLLSSADVPPQLSTKWSSVVVGE